MAEREPQKAKKRAVAQRKAPPKASLGQARTANVSPAPAVAPGVAATDPSARVRMLEAERDRLKAELDAAKVRIAALEAARDQALNRIAWVIDSLHTLED